MRTAAGAGLCRPVAAQRLMGRALRMPLTLLRRFGLALAVAALLGMATESVYRSALSAQRDRVYAEFQLAAAHRINALRERIETVLDLQRMLARHVEIAGVSSSAAFARIAAPLMRIHEFITAIACADVVAQADGPPAYITRHSVGRHRAPAVGTDLADGSVAARAALASAQQLQHTVATPLLRPATGAVEGVRVFTPAGTGIIALSLQLSRLAQDTLWSGMDPDARDMAFTILDATTDPRGAPEIYRDALGDEFETAHVEAIKFGERRWLVMALPTPHHYRLEPSTALTRQRYAGWAITLLATLIVVFLSSRNRVIRGNVIRRTTQLARTNQMLAEANATLEAEVRQRTRSEAALRDSTALQQAILHSADHAIVLTDTDGTIRVFNPAAERLLGCTADSAVGQRTPVDFIDPGDLATMETRTGERGVAAVLAATRQLSSTEPVELDLRRADGKQVPASISVSPLVDATTGVITGYLTIAADITQRRASEAHIKRLAHFDSLTDLPNRSLLLSRLEAALEIADTCDQPLALLFLDLDRFKNVNDSLGHQAGDALLQAVSGRFRHCVREQDTVARMGGDEFIVLLPEIDGPEHAAEVASRIIEALAAPFDIKGHRLTVTPSIGIAIYPEHGISADLLVKHADAAMYHAKERGRNKYQFYETRFSTRASVRLTLENRLRRALERNEFALAYQLQADTESGAFIGVEALLRWYDPEKGLILPDTFIPVAEDSGLIVPLGEWMLRTACAQNQAWRAAGLLDVPVAVNLSARQFDEHTLLATVAQALEDTGLPPARLELELTETLIMRNPALAAELLEAGKRMGMLICIDDFGTGYSSLAYLRRFRIDRLKIDRSFIADIETEPDDATIARTIIAMAHTLRIDVLAEGVETEAQLRMLREWGCDGYQGYLCSRPLSAEDLTERLQGMV